MNIVKGIHHKRTIEDVIIITLQVAICAMIIGIGAMFAVDAWVKEDIARVDRLKQHIYDVAYGKATYGPAAPRGVRPNYGDLSEPKTRVFADAGSKPKAVK